MKIFKLIFIPIFMTILLSCQRDNITDNFGRPYMFCNEYFDGNGFYPFPDGTYSEYLLGDLSEPYKIQMIFTDLHNNGIKVLEAWEIRGIFGSKVYVVPELILLLREKYPQLDTLKFSYIDKPRIGHKAKIRHYYF